MINIDVKRENGIEFDFDIDTNFRTAILGENGIGKSSIIESIYNKTSNKGWFSVFVPKNIKISYFSQIEINNQKISGGEHTKKRLEKLFEDNADLYIMDEPTNNLDTKNIDWLKNKIIKDKIKIIFTSHDIAFIDDIAEVIFYLDSKGVEKTQEKCSEYLVSRKKKVEQAFVKYEVNLKKHEKLEKAVTLAKQEFKEGINWINEDKMLQGFKREQAGKFGGAAIKRIKKRAASVDVEEPEFDPIPFVRLECDPKHKDYIEIASNSFLNKRINFSIKKEDKKVLSGPNGSGKTTFIKKIIEYMENGEVKPEDNFSKSGNINYIYLSQNWYEEIDNITPSEYMAKFGLTEQEKYNALSYNHIDPKNLNKPFKEISPGIRIKILLGSLSMKKFDFIIWDEPTNHLDVMTQLVLKEAFIKYNGMLLLVTHDRNLTDDKSFTKINF